MSKRFCILLAVVVILGLQPAANPATLQAGWYVNLNAVEFSWYYVSGDRAWESGSDGQFNTPPGTYGPFQVTEPGGEYDYNDRWVAVPNIAAAGGADSLTLPFTVAYAQPGYKWPSMQFNWQTNYDASQMYVSLWSNPSGGAPVCIWSQMLSGAQASSPTLDLSVVDSNYYFSVFRELVPETNKCHAG